MLLFKQIKTIYIKIVNKFNDNRTLYFAIFFCLGLYTIMTKKDSNILLSAAPAAAAAGAKAATAAKAAKTASTAKSVADGATAAKTAGSVASSGAQGLNAAKTASGLPGQQGPTLPNKNTDGNALKKGLGDKSPKLDESVKQKSSVLEEVSKEKKKLKIGFGNEEVEIDEDDSSIEEGSTELMGKKKNDFLKIAIIFLPILFLFLVIIISFIYVSPVSFVLYSVFQNTNVKSKGNELNEIYEKSSDFVFDDSSIIIDKRIEDKLVEEYNKYYSEYGTEINIPLIVATLFYDVYSEEREINSNENIKIERINARVNAISDLAENMLSIKENEFLCAKSVNDEQVNIYELKFVGSMSVDKKVRIIQECNEENVGKKIYSYSREVDYDKYNKYLLESNILSKLYSRKFFEDGTEEEKQKVINEINSSYSMFSYLYFEGKIDICEEKKRIPYNVLEKLDSPLVGNYYISSYFGPRPNVGNGTFHKGIDAYYASGEDDSVYSVGLLEGVVADVGETYEGGIYVKIKYVIDEVEYYTYYGHLKEDSVTVKKGDLLEERQVIAKVGNTGVIPGTNTRVGKHLHFHISKGPLYTFESVYNPIDLYLNALNYTNPCGGN